MSGNVFVDIETARDDEAAKAWIARRTYSAPANYGEEAAKKDIAKKKKTDWDRAALNLHTNRVVVVTIAHDSDPAVTLVSHGPNEKKMIETVSLALSQAQTIVTFNGRSFDLPCLRMRHLKYGIKLPHVLTPESRYAMQREFDLREALTGFNNTMKGTLTDWCAFAGTPLPKPHAGPGVAKMVEEGKLEQLAAVCESDVEALRHLFNTTTSINWN